MKYYNLSTIQTLKKLETDQTGLSSKEANNRLKKFGKNEINVRTTSLWKKILTPFLDAFMIVLIVAAVISFLHGDSLDAIIITIIVVINAVISWVQEFSTERILRQLRKTSVQMVDVLRDGQHSQISQYLLVPGDIVSLKEGDKVPADGRILTDTSLRVNESLLTGESVPVSKTAAALTEEDLEAYQQTNMLFQGSFIIAGNLEMVVTTTGLSTEFGRIAELSSHISSESPVQTKINKLVSQIIIASGILAIIAFVLSLWRGMELVESVKFVLTLIVSVVPEGLPIAISIILALGMRKMAREKSLVRNLRAIETVGVITTIATDKTGTLTANQLSIQKTMPLIDDNDLLQSIFQSKNLSEKTHDPLDQAMDDFLKKSGQQFSQNQPLASFNFNQELALSGNLYPYGEKFRLVVKGAPEQLISRSNNSNSDKKKLKTETKTLAAQGFRIIATGEVVLDDKINSLEDIKDNHNFITKGIVGIADILRPESAEAIKAARAAGVSVRMITGDHPETAFYIGQELGLADSRDQIFDASKIKNLDDDQLEKAILEARVFARITPESKFKIVKILEKTEITAMTGDGVNDVPALAAANVGFSMGSGSEIAKDASDIVLLDDNFNSIVVAMKEGRTIVANIRRMLFYALSTNAGEALTMISALVIGIPLPLVPVQILWINLVTDTALIIPLGLEPVHPEIMKRQPESPNSPILGRTSVLRMILVATLMAIISIIFFIHYTQTIGEAGARTLTFTALAIMQWGNAVNARSSDQSILKRIKTPNRSFAIGMLAAIGLQLAAIFTPFGDLLHVVSVPLSSLILVSTISFIAPIILVEIHKLAIKYFTR